MKFWPLLCDILGHKLSSPVGKSSSSKYTRSASFVQSCIRCKEVFETPIMRISTPSARAMEIIADELKSMGLEYGKGFPSGFWTGFPVAMSEALDSMGDDAEEYVRQSTQQTFGSRVVPLEFQR